MKKILLLSDTHSYVGQRVLDYAKDADEVWHAGDVGSPKIIKRLEECAPVRGVYGNIDGEAIKRVFPLEQDFKSAGLSVYMIHIGGYPGRYKKGVRQQIKTLKPDLFVCGHSHILKVMRDKELGLLHMNPGAVGNQGFHQVRTMIRFIIEQGEIKNPEVIELGRRGKG